MAQIGRSTLGPKMKALANDQMRAFVWFLMQNGGKVDQAAADAGFCSEDDPHSATAASSLLMARRDVLEALEELNAIWDWAAVF